MKKLLKIYFVLSGLFIALSIPAGFYYVLKTYSLTPRQFLVKGAQKLSISSPDLLALLAPAPRYRDRHFDGRIKSSHPRILALDVHGWNGESSPAPFILEKKAYFDARKRRLPDPCPGGGMINSALCWMSTGNPAAAEKAIALMAAYRHETPDVQSTYGNAWGLALAYDLLSLYPHLGDAARTRVRSELRAALGDYLKLLDEDSPSLWHGRASLAANAWLCAVMLDPATDEDQDLVTRAQGHFLDVMGALGITEAWPEGYNYWIQNRAFVLALAASAYVNGLEDSEIKPEISRIIERSGLWPLYAMRPDRRVENLGDEGSRVDLKDETQRVIDIVAQTTGNAILGTFSGLIGKLHGVEGYYRDYRWGMWLFNQPTKTFMPDGSLVDHLRYFDRTLPKSQIFGRGAMNLVYIHSGWGADATFISYHAGHTFSHHGHYDAGHFSLYKGAPLAVNSSRYGGGVFSANRLNYSARTVAKNSLLILRPGESVAPNRFFTDNVADGGQRLTLPTGSSISGLDMWRENLYAHDHYEGGELLAYAHADGYTYVASDLTGAYNSTRFDDNGHGGKVSRVQREMLYLEGEDQLVIHDTVAVTDPAYPVKWLLHTANKPLAGGLRILKGSAQDGILASPEKSALVVNEPGYLKVDRLLPREGEMRFVGGPNYRFYVEADADETVLDGKNFFEGGDLEPWFDQADWRIELNAPPGESNHEFLVVLAPSLKGPKPDHPQLVRDAGATIVVVLAESTLVFVRPRARVNLALPMDGHCRHLYLVGDIHGKGVRIDGEPIELPPDTPAIFHRAFPPGSPNSAHSLEIRG